MPTSDVPVGGSCVELNDWGDNQAFGEGEDSAMAFDAAGAAYEMPVQPGKRGRPARASTELQLAALPEATGASGLARELRQRHHEKQRSALAVQARRRPRAQRAPARRSARRARHPRQLSAAAGDDPDPEAVGRAASTMKDSIWAEEGCHVVA